MKKFIISLFIILNIAITSCYAASWVRLDDNNFIDKDSIKIYVDDKGYMNYNKRIFWTKYEGNGIYKDLEKVTNSKIEYGLTQFIIDYSNYTIAAKAGMTYDKNGKPISSYSYQDFKLKYDSIVPDSSAELWAELIKKPRVLKKMYKWQQSQLLRTE
ncbi:hypothetical protein IJ541_03505 [bacterium]|nr:hypothetical protein [bacterium]